MFSFVVSPARGMRALALGLGVAVVLPVQVLAQGAPAADAAYQRGVGHFKAGRFVEAIQEFNKAYRVDRNPVLIYNIARAFEELGELDKAVSYYERYLREAPADAPDRAAVEGALETLVDLIERQRELAAREKLAEGFEAGITSSPDGAMITVDGEAVGQAPVQMRLKKGRHFVVAEYEGFARASKEVVVASDGLSVHIDLLPVAVSPPAEKSNVLPWTLVGVGGALVAGAAVAGMMALDKNGELDDIDSGKKTLRSPGAYDDLQDEGRAWALTADGLLVAGVVSAAVGATLFFWDDDGPSRGPNGEGEEAQGLGFRF